MPKRIIGVIVLASGLVWSGFLYFSHHNLAVLSPKGTIAAQQKHLILLAAIMMLVVVIPVFVLTYGIAWKYRASNHRARHEPDWDHNLGLELMWWGIPSVLILVLAIISWTSTHALDPFKPIISAKPPLTVQVVALQWKWLFVYPSQNIASINDLEIPINTPVNFEITSDAPMNSFWIPQLAGQVYAMAGMRTQLHVMATSEGTYRGVSANISGSGFSDMHFNVKSVSNNEFLAWVKTIQQNQGHLDKMTYAKLLVPSSTYTQAYFGSVAPGMFNDIIIKYMSPMGSSM